MTIQIKDEAPKKMHDVALLGVAAGGGWLDRDVGCQVVSHGGH